MIPLKHQEKFANDYKGKRLIVHEGGTGKTVCACLWLKDKKRDRYALVVCPKKVVKKWQKALSDWGTKATVLSKEEFKLYPDRGWSAIVVDEADEFASPLFVKGRSQRTEKLYNLLKTYPAQTLLLTATPVRSNPWNLHTLLCFIGVYIHWQTWRAQFFVLEKRPYLPRPAYLPRPNWRQLMRPLLEKYADIVLLKDCVEELPPVAEEVVKLKSEPFTSTEWEGSKAFFEEHKHEQKVKPKEIIEIGKEYRKVLVVAYYVEQVAELKKELSKDRETFSIHGGVKDQEDIIKAAQDSDECYFIVQASMGAGFDLETFSCAVFASMSYAVRDYVQMTYRMRRIHALHPVVYYYLIAGRCDRNVFKNVKAGFDFVPSLWKPHELTESTETIQEEGSEDRRVSLGLVSK